MRVLFLEDESVHEERVRTALETAGHQVWSFNRGSAALRHLEHTSVDLLVVDWDISDMSGIEVLGWVRSHLSRQLPVIMLTNHSTEDQAVQSLNGGADAYLVKPVDVCELVVRVARLLHRAWPEAPRHAEIIEVADYRLSRRGSVVKVGDRTMLLAPREFEIAWLLFRHIGQTVLREQLFTRVWGKHAQDWDSRSLDTHIYRLRKKLELCGKHGLRLCSIYQHGYCLAEIKDRVMLATACAGCAGVMRRCPVGKGVV